LIPFDWVIEAKLVLTDELMKRGAEERVARMTDQDLSEDEEGPDQ
jgi:ribosome maturation factor RimP